jgi:hypothetical protein
MNPVFLLIALLISASGASEPQHQEAPAPVMLARNDTESSQPGAQDRRPSTPAVEQSSQPQVSSLLPVRAPHEGVKADLFSGHSWYKPPPPPPERVRTQPVDRAPTAPPLPFTYIGRYEQKGAVTLYYLVKDDRVYDVKVGDVIDNTYRVDKVANGQLMFTYLPLKSSQGLRLGDQQ